MGTGIFRGQKPYIHNLSLRKPKKIRRDLPDAQLLFTAGIAVLAGGCIWAQAVGAGGPPGSAPAAGSQEELRLRRAPPERQAALRVRRKRNGSVGNPTETWIAVRHAWGNNSTTNSPSGTDTGTMPMGTSNQTTSGSTGTSPETADNPTGTTPDTTPQGSFPVGNSPANPGTTDTPGGTAIPGLNRATALKLENLTWTLWRRRATGFTANSYWTGTGRC